MDQILKTDLSLKNGQINMISGTDNLIQVIEHKLLTRRGELEDLGHPDYGSRLYTLIGEPDTKRTRALAEFYIREALEDEERIQDISNIYISPFSIDSDKKNKLFITLNVQQIDESQTLEIDITLE